MRIKLLSIVLLLWLVVPCGRTQTQDTAAALSVEPAPVESTINLDYDILCGLQQRRTPCMDKVMVWVSNSLALTPVVPSAFLIAGRYSDDAQLTFVGAATGFSFLTAGALMEGLKYSIRRPRPYLGYPDDLIPVKTTIGYSFPSGHTSLTFAVATSLSLCYSKWYVVVPSFLWAGSVAFSRLYLGVHYPSDVLTGVLVGTLSGFVGHWLSQRLWEVQGLPAPQAVTVPVVIQF